MNSRIDIERAILGAILYCDGFAKVAHILSAKNFSSSPVVKHRDLYDVFGRLFPARPIDLLTVSHEIKVLNQDNDEMRDLLYACGTGVQASSNIGYWAIILLQIDLSEKYKESLLDWKNKRDRDFEYSESGALHEVIETINTNEDIFEIIDKSVQYFNKMNMKYEFDQATQYFKDVVDRTRSIQKVNSLQVALRYLLAISDCTDVVVKDQCEKLAKAIADMITTGETNPRYTEAVNIIYQ